MKLLWIVALLTIISGCKAKDAPADDDSTTLKPTPGTTVGSTQSPITETSTQAPITDSSTKASTYSSTQAPITDSSTQTPITKAPITDSSTQTPKTDSTTPSPKTDSPSTPVTTEPQTTAPSTPTISPSTSAPSTIAKGTSGSTIGSTKGSTSGSTPSGTNTETVDIRYVNDLRYNLFPVDDKSTICSKSVESTEQCFGGVACLWQKKSAASTAVWLHAGNALGTVKDGDKYRALKLAPATAVLQQLKFNALSFDSDMLRYGVEEANLLVEGVGKDDFVTSNYLGTFSGAVLSPYKIISPSAGLTCSIAVIGITNPDTAVSYSSASMFSDTLTAIASTVTKIQTDNPNKKILYVVIGEASNKLASDILYLDNVAVVIHSGDNNVTEIVAENQSIKSQKKLRATLPPTDSRSMMQIGKLSLSLDANCLITADVKAVADSYSSSTDIAKTCAAVAPAPLTKAISDGRDGLEAMTQVQGRSLVTLSGALKPCGIMGCSLGQLLADGVRAAVISSLLKDTSRNMTWKDAPRAVVLPAWVLSTASSPVLADGADITKQTLLAALEDDAFLCTAKFTGQQMYALMEAMLSLYSWDGGAVPTSSFPQVSGLSMDVDITAPPGERVLALYAQMMDLTMLTVDPTSSDPSDSSSTRSGVINTIFPCVLLDRDLLVKETLTKEFFSNLKTTLLDLTLLDGLMWQVQSQTVLVPPVTDVRVRLRHGWLSTSQICEDWTGPTVFYTILVMVALCMIGYQGYQYWRFRSVLSYVR